MKKSNRVAIFHLYERNSPVLTQQNLTKLGMWVGVADVINHAKFGNRLRGTKL